MITSVTHDLQAARNREDIVYRHIGRLAARSAEIDENMTVVLARALSPDRTEVAVKTFRGLFFARKLEYLGNALPASWPDKKNLLSWLKKIEDYRNNIAHRTVGTRFSLSTDVATTHLHSIKGDVALEFDEAEFARWEARAYVMHFVMVQLAWSTETDISSTDLRALLLAGLPDETTERLEARDELFPAKVTTSQTVVGAARARQESKRTGHTLGER